jgi:hypothetical protein
MPHRRVAAALVGVEGGAPRLLPALPGQLRSDPRQVRRPADCAAQVCDEEVGVRDEAEARDDGGSFEGEEKVPVFGFENGPAVFAYACPEYDASFGKTQPHRAVQILHDAD